MQVEDQLRKAYDEMMRINSGGPGTTRDHIDVVSFSNGAASRGQTPADTPQVSSTVYYLHSLHILLSPHPY